MAWRIDEQLVRGEIDNRTRGRVTGRLWFVGREEPLTLDLTGNAWRDVAGHVLRFTNRSPKAGEGEVMKGIASVQRGAVGDITASRKVKVPDCSMDEVMECYKARKPFPWHWGNSLYLEWHGEVNGRIVIEAAHYTLELDAVSAWTMSEEEEQAQREENGRAMAAFMERLGPVAEDDFVVEDFSPTEANLADAEDDKNDDGDDDADATDAEAQADADQARMDLLLDRVQARLARAREAGEPPGFERIMEEERERLRRERGEPDPEPLTPEEEGERVAWVAEMNEIAEEAQAQVEADKWKDEDDAWHPLVERCNVFRENLDRVLRERGWLTENDAHEHPLRELVNGVMIAGGKLAGALGSADDSEEWPPDALFAGGVLVRLKKAREHLRDALAGLTAADEMGLAEAEWRMEMRAEAMAIMAEVRRLIAEVRAVLRDAEGAGGDVAGD